MKLRNEIIVICLICFILIGITSVSAEDNNTNIITGNDNIHDDSLSVDNENQIIKDNEGNFEDLNTTINGGSSTVEIDQNYTYTSSFNEGRGIEIIQDNFTVDGKGHTIDGNGQSRIFNVTGTNVTLKNIVFVNGFAGDSSGGAVFGYGDNLRVLNCTFINNTASNWGGAIYSYPDTYSVFYNSKFINNRADKGGALATIYGYRQDVLNCVFESNNATGFGGALLIYGTLSTEDRPWDDHVNIKGSIFTGNNAPTGDAICNYKSAYINMTDSIVLGDATNLVDSWGAMFFADYNWWGNTYDNRSVRPEITNSVKFTKWLYFDVIANSGETDLTVSINNLYDSDSGASSIHPANNLPSITVGLSGTNVTFASENATLDSTGICKVPYTVEDKATVTASYYGISVTKNLDFGSFAALQNLIRNARNNTIITLDRDYVYSVGDIITEGILISDKNNITIDGRGHTVNAAGKSRVFRVSYNSKDIVIKNVKIVNGKSNGTGEGYFGAGMVWQSTNGRMINCSFINNYAYGLTSGGALYWSGNNGYLIDCTFINNTHGYSKGGAVAWYGSGAHIVHCVFENNSAEALEGSGGAIYLSNAEAYITDCNFTNNRAKSGGAIDEWSYGDAVSTISNCIFKANVATTTGSDLGGGAICADYVSIINSVFLENQAKDGAAVYCSNEHGSIEKCVFINNTAGLNGVIFWNKGGTISNSIFLNNDASYGGHILTCIYGGLKANDNWYGNIWKNYANTPNVDNRANMTRWIFLNATEPIYDEDSGSFTTQFNFMEYDAASETINSYDSSKLPQINLKLSSQNLTINKSNVELGETIEGTTTFYMGNLIAEYENVRYVLPFKYQKISWIETNQSIIITIDKTKTLSYTVHPFEEATLFLKDYITYVSNDTSVVKVDRQGKITGLKAGTANVTINYSGRNPMGYDVCLPSSINITVTVVRIETSIDLYSTVDSLNAGDSGSFGATVKPNRGSGTLTYSCNDTQVLRLDEYGSYRALAGGTVNVTVSFSGDDKYAPSQASFTVKVNRKPTRIVGTDVGPINIDMNNNYILYVYLDPDRAGLLNCTSNDTSVATAVFDNGVCRISGVGPGLANVTIFFPGSSEYEPCSADVLVNVTACETRIDVNETLNVFLRDTGRIEYSIKPYNIFELVFTSNDTSVLNFTDNYGNYEAVGKGVANVTIQLIPHGKYLPSSANVIVTVSSVETNITVNPTYDLYVGQKGYLNAKLNPDAGDLTYESNDTSVINITGRGYVQALKEGVAKITVSYIGVDRYLSSNATVIITVQKGPTRIDVDDEIVVYIKDVKYLNAHLICEWNNWEIYGIEYECNDTSVLVMNGNYMDAKSLGVVELTLKYNGSDKYLPTSKKILVSVVLVPSEISAPSEITLLNGETDNINATLNHAGQLNYLSDNPSVVTVDENGNIVAYAIGSANITITFNETERYAAASKTVAVEVAGSKVQTNLTANETIEIYVGNSTNIEAAITPISALLNGNLTYAVGNPEILEIDGNGNIRGLKVGTTTVTISYAENGRFLANSTVVNVIVKIIPSEIAAPENVTLNLTESASIGAQLISPTEGQLTYEVNDGEIATVDENGVITAHKIGDTFITISYAGNENYTASSKTVQVKVVAVSTAIETVGNVEVNLSESYRIDAKLIPYRTGKLHYESSNSSVATVNEYGYITAVGVGEANITVSFAGEGKYLPNSTVVHVKVTAVETSIDIADNIEINKTETANLAGVVVPYPNGRLTYESTNSSVVSVDFRGVVTAHEFGEADIIVRFAGQGKYLPSEATVHVMVVGVETTITAEEYIEVDAASQGQIEASLSPYEEGRLTFSSNDSSILSINQNGRYNALKIGSANITISFAGEGKYLPASKNVIITVKGLKSEITVNDTVSASPLDTFNMNARLIPSNGKLNYVSNDTAIVSVDENGTVTVHKVGLAKITVSFVGNDQYLPAEVNVTVNSTKLQPKIEFIGSEYLKINGTNATVQVSWNGRLNFELNYDEIRKYLNYSSSNPDILSIVDGNLSAIGGGIAEITVSYEGNERYEAFSEKLNFTVIKRLTEIRVNGNITLRVDDIRDIGATLISMGVDFGNRNLKYAIDNPDVISIAGGKVTALKKGTAKINITYDENPSEFGSTAVVNVTVIAKATRITPEVENIFLEVFESSKVSATLNYPEDGEITFKSSDESVVTVDNSGNVNAIGKGTAIITASYAGCDDYLPCEANITVKVTPVPTAINVIGFTPLIMGNSIVLNATLSPDVGQLVYTSGDSSIVYVDSNTGMLTGINTGTTFVNVEFKGNNQYDRSIKQVTVQVILDTTSITVNDHMQIEVGHRVNLNAILNPAEAGYLTYTSNNERIAAVDSNGNVQGRSEGMTIITVRFEGNPQYIGCEQKVTVIVNRDASSVKFDLSAEEDSKDTTFSLNLPQDADGTFTVFVDGKEYQSKTLVGGKASIEVDGLTPGDHKITLKYSGDNKYAAVTQDKTIHIKEVKLDKNSDVSAMFTTTAKYTVRLKVDTQVVAGKTVTFKVNGQKYYVKTDKKGFATISVKLPAGKYTVTAEYKGVKVKNTITFKHIIVAKNLKVKKSANSKKITVKLNKVNNKVLKGKKVTLKFKGKKYTAKTNKKGIAKFTLKKSVLSKLKVGKKYKYKVFYGKDKVTKKIKIKK
ncbi:Ig-like domain-containing protein [Methanobrevibacter sp.]